MSAKKRLGEVKENLTIMKEMFRLIKQNKKWWLLPIFIVFSFLSLFLVVAGGNGVLPAIYALF